MSKAEFLKRNLLEGEMYAGIILDTRDYHLILLPDVTKAGRMKLKADWQPNWKSICQFLRRKLPLSGWRWKYYAQKPIASQMTMQPIWCKSRKYRWRWNGLPKLDK